MGQVEQSAGQVGLGGSHRHVRGKSTDVALLRRRGSLDAVAAAAGALAGAARPADVVVDLTELAFADPSLMLDLAMVARRLRKAGRELTLHDAQPDISVLIEYVGLHRLPGVKIAPAPAPA